MDIFNIKAIETGIVLAGTILLFSLMVTACNEFLVRLLNLRGRILRMFFLRFLGSDLAKSLEQNVWITFHKKPSWWERLIKRKRRPKEVSPVDFARAILLECTQDSVAGILSWSTANRLFLPHNLFDVPFRISWQNEEKILLVLQKWHDAQTTNTQQKETLATLLHTPSLNKLGVMDICGVFF
jgi:hypothetical protein